MTYNQLITTLQSLLESHAMIKSVKNETPKEWIFRETQPQFPIALFSVNSSTLNKGLNQIYSVQFFFLDKSGDEAEFEQDVISDQLQICSDIVGLIRSGRKSYSIDDLINVNTISDKYEDYLAGVEMTVNIETQGEWDGCDVPLI